MSSSDARCPQCGAMLRGEAAWCTLCHADLRPAPAPVPVSVPDLPGPDIVVNLDAVTLPPVVIDPLTAPIDMVVAAALAEQEAERTAAVTPLVAPTAPAVPPAPTAPAPAGLSAAPTAAPLAAPAVADGDPANPLAGIEDTEVLFALLRGETQDPLLAKYGGRFDDKTTRVMFMIGGVAVMTLVGFAGLYVVGLIFG